MPLPDFTNDEQLLIVHVKSPNAAGISNPFMWGYLLSAIIIATFAAYYESIPMMLAAFLVVCGFRIYEEFRLMKWTPIWRSIIEKYETASSAHSRSITKSSDETP